MKCKCGFKFSRPGEYRNCAPFITKYGDSGVICPGCSTHYINIGRWVEFVITDDEESLQ